MHIPAHRASTPWRSRVFRCSLLASLFVLLPIVYNDRDRSLVPRVVTELPHPLPHTLPTAAAISPPPLSIVAGVNMTVPPWARGGSVARALPGVFRDQYTGQWSPRDDFPNAAWKNISKSQDVEDFVALEGIFDGKRGGIVIESGALDGLQFSNSWLLVFGFGWYAIHIEAIPNNFASLTRGDGLGYHGRPESLNIHAALCSDAGVLHYAEKGGAASPINGLWEFMSADHRTTWWPELISNPERIARLPTIPCSRLTPLLEPFALTHIDLWILDVEGAELAVLHTLDFDRVRVDVIAVETDFGTEERYDKVRSFLAGKGYRLHHNNLWRNDWFLHKDFVLPSHRAAFEHGRSQK